MNRYYSTDARSKPIAYRKLLKFLLLSFCVTSIHSAFTAVAQDAYYRGKTIRILVGFAPGGPSDAYSRIYARQLPKYIPGNPTVVVMNMPSAGGLIAANNLFSSAKPDGLTIGMVSRPQITAQLFQKRNVSLDARKLEWIGAPFKEQYVCAIKKDAGIATIQDWVSKRTPLTLGATLPNYSIEYLTAAFLQRDLGLPVRIVSGYKASSELLLATLKGELDGACGISTLLTDTTWSRAIAAQGVVVIPLSQTLLKNESARVSFQFIENLGSTAYSFALPSSTPRDRTDLLRRAFQNTAKDPEFIAEIKKQRLKLNPITGEQIQKDVAQIFEMSSLMLAKLDIKKDSGTGGGGGSSGARPTPPPPAPRPPPPPPPPPATKIEPKKGDVAPIPKVFWNAWAEQSDELKLNPINHLKPETTYLLALDLAALAYGEGAQSQAPSAPLKGIIPVWLNTKLQSVRLTALALGDPAYFKSPPKPANRLTIDLSKIRKLQKGEIKLPRDPLDVLKRDSNPDFLFGRTTFEITTTSKQGRGSIGISIWKDNRPLDEIILTFCVATDSTAPLACKGTRPIPFGLQGIDSLRVASQAGVIPDASLHFVDLSADSNTEANGIGVFREKSWPENVYKTWKLDRTITFLRAYLKDTMLKEIGSAQYNEKKLAEQGSYLYDLFFPRSKEGGGADARASFEEFVKRQFVSGIPSNNDPPSIFVRMVPKGPDPVPMVPLGLLTLNIDNKPRFLGLHFRIETPLPVQTYDDIPNCLTRWVVLFPPQQGDTALKDARKHLAKLIDDWEGKADIQDSLSSFKSYIHDSHPEAIGTALLVVTHHDSNRFWHATDDSMPSIAVQRQFTKPSIAILNGCGTGGPGAVDFIKRFSENGIGTVIATNAEVDGAMAGDFVNCLAAVLEKNKNVSGFNISKAYFQALTCLRQHKTDGQDREGYGARVLLYSLLGNGGLRVCSPERGGVQ